MLPTPPNGASPHARTYRSAWIKAGDGSMTSAFATLPHDSAGPLAPSGAPSDPAGALSMRELPGGITVQPGTSREQASGGLHPMLMGVHEAVKPGQAPVITPYLADGSTIPVLRRTVALNTMPWTPARLLRRDCRCFRPTVTWSGRCPAAWIR